MSRIEPAVQLEINKAVTAAKESWRKEQRDFEKEIGKEVGRMLTPISRMLTNQNLTLTSLRDESRQVKADVNETNKRLYKGEGSLLSRLARNEQVCISIQAGLAELEAQQGKRNAITVTETEEKVKLTIRDMDNQTKIRLALLALIPGTLALVPGLVALYLKASEATP